MGHLKPQSQDASSAMKYLWILVLFSMAFAEPEAEAEADAKADPLLLYGGHYLGGYYPKYYGHYGYGLGLWGRKKREAEAAPLAEADAEAAPDAEADPYLLYGGHYLGGYYPRYFGHYGYGLGLWGRKKREAEAGAEAAPTADANADPWLYYVHGGYYGLGHYYGGWGGYGWGGYWG